MGLIGNELGLRPEEARRTGEKVIAHLLRGNYEAAHVAISRAEFTVQDKPNSVLGDTPLAQAEFCTRTLNLMERHGVLTFGDLTKKVAEKGDDWILRVSGGGEGTLHEIQRILHYELMRRKQ